MTTKWKTFPVLARAFFCSCAKRSSSPATSPPRTTCFDIFSPPSGDSDVISHVDLLSSNETNIAARSERIAFGASGRSAAVCMVVSRVGGRNLTLPERRSLSTSPWDLDRLRRHQRAQKITEIVGQRMKLKPDRIGGERTARQSCPSDRALALLDPLFARPALVIEGDHTLGGSRHVGDDESNARIKFAQMPFDLGDDAAGFCPTPSLIGEVRIGAPHFVRRPSNRARQQMADSFLQDAVRR